MAWLNTGSRRSITAVLAVFVAMAVGLTVAAEPSAAAYKPTVKLTKYRVHRGHRDHAQLRHFKKNHAGSVYVRQGGHKYVLKRFTTGPLGGAKFFFRVIRKLHVGWHKFHFRTGTLQVIKRIKVLR